MGFNPNFYQELGELIDKYAFNKSEQDAYKELCDEDNKKIKEMMLGADIKNYATSKFKATCIQSTRQYFDEEKLIKVIHTNDLPESLGIIKTKEYIDEDALETAIYNGYIDEDTLKQITDCMIEKVVNTLKISKVKEV